MVFSPAAARRLRTLAPLVAVVGAAASSSWLASCLPPPATVPTNQPVYPRGIAVTKDGNHLIVTSSDFDLAFTDGALLSADLVRARAAAAARPNAATVPVVSDDYTSVVILPPFSDRPVLSENGDRVFVPIGQVNRIASIDVAANGALSCGAAGHPQRCGESPRAVQFPRNDPFNIIPLHEDAQSQRVDAMVTMLSSSVVFFFRDDAAQTGAQRMQITGSLDLGADTIGGVRGAVLRPAKNGSPATVFAGVDLATPITSTDQTQVDPFTGLPTGNTIGIIGADLLAFEPKTSSPITSFDITATTGALSMRDLILIEAPATPAAPPANDAIIAVLRPIGVQCCDAIARFEITDTGALPEVHLARLADACKGPTQLAYAAPPVDRVLVTCNDDDTVQALDPVSLNPTDAIRFQGRGPYGIVVKNGAEPEAYVSFFLDNSVAMLRLMSGTVPKMSMVVRIGEQAPLPEDGRQ